MQIRSAEFSDLAAISRCEALAFAPFSPAMSSDKLQQNLATQIEEGVIHVIAERAGVLGYISLWPSVGHLFIDTLAVLPERHGEGLGSQLLAFAEREAVRLRLSSLRLFTKEKMADNLGFYLRRGYRETGRCDDDGFARVFYVKDISQRVAGAAGSAARV